MDGCWFGGGEDGPVADSFKGCFYVCVSVGVYLYGGEEEDGDEEGERSFGW